MMVGMKVKKTREKRGAEDGLCRSDWLHQRQPEEVKGRPTSPLVHWWRVVPLLATAKGGWHVEPAKLLSVRPSFFLPSDWFIFREERHEVGQTPIYVFELIQIDLSIPTNRGNGRMYS